MTMTTKRQKGRQQLLLHLLLPLLLTNGSSRKYGKKWRLCRLLLSSRQNLNPRRRGADPFVSVEMPL
jgi:hypothetical protein